MSDLSVLDIDRLLSMHRSRLGVGCTSVWMSAVGMWQAIFCSNRLSQMMGVTTVVVWWSVLWGISFYPEQNKCDFHFAEPLRDFSSSGGCDHEPEAPTGTKSAFSSAFFARRRRTAKPITRQ